MEQLEPASTVFPIALMFDAEGNYAIAKEPQRLRTPGMRVWRHPRQHARRVSAARRTAYDDHAGDCRRCCGPASITTPGD
jgi:hypothetical protein